MTEDTVADVLREARVAEELLLDVLDVIRSDAQIVFAIFVRISKVSDVIACLEADTRDGSLPICDDTTPPVPSEFLTAQWEFLAPVFLRSRILKQIRDDAVLPFVQDEKISRGGFSTVYKIAIPANHQNLVAVVEGQNVRGPTHPPEGCQ